MEKRGGEGADNTQPRRTEGRELGRRREREDGLGVGAAIRSPGLACWSR